MWQDHCLIYKKATLRSKKSPKLCVSLFNKKKLPQNGGGFRSGSLRSTGRIWSILPRSCGNALRASASFGYPVLHRGIWQPPQDSHRRRQFVWGDGWGFGGLGNKSSLESSLRIWMGLKYLIHKWPFFLVVLVFFMFCTQLWHHIFGYQTNVLLYPPGFLGLF